MRMMSVCVGLVGAGERQVHHDLFLTRSALDLQ